MTKDESIKASTALLNAIYGGGFSVDYNALATIQTANATKDVVTLCAALDGVVDFIGDLKRDLKQE